MNNDWYANFEIDEFYVEETGSTNSDLLGYAHSHRITRPRLLCARHQTAGRGTHGREWKSLGKALTFSIAIPIDGDLKNWVGVTLAVGVSIAKMYQSFDVPAKVKWPNDILLFDKKLSGILIEVTQDIDKKWVLIIGVGTNCVRECHEELEIGYGVSFLSDVIKVDDLRLWQTRISQAILSAVTQMGKNGLVSICSTWDTISAYPNETVWVMEEGKPSYQAILKGIDNQGCLLIQTSNGVKSLMSGTISLRKVNK